MTDLWLTVPTAGRATFAPMLDFSGIPPERCAVVVTAPGVDVPAGCHVIEDFDEINIHRWWNRGIDYAVAHGARWVAVVNDDIVLSPDTLPTIVAAMQKYGAALGSPGGDGHYDNPNRDLAMTMLGSCFVLDTSTTLRPDEGYRWWYGDNDLDHRARRDHGGIATARCYFQHMTPNQLTAESEELLALTRLDAQRWAQG